MRNFCTKWGGAAMYPIAIAVYFAVAMAAPSATYKVIPFSEGGLPIPFQTKIADSDGDGIPDWVGMYAIGPGGVFMGYARKPSPSEIRWYMSKG